MDTTLPKRKPTRLRTYSYSNVGYYFITICAENKEKMFGKIVGGGTLDAPLVQLTEIGKAIDDHVQSTNRIPGVVVDKYVIMPNHFHMILSFHESEQSLPDLSRVVQQTKRRVSKILGMSIWQSHYFDRVIRGEADYRAVWEYIDNNPTKWSLDKYYNEG